MPVKGDKSHAGVQAIDKELTGASFYVSCRHEGRTPVLLTSITGTDMQSLQAAVKRYNSAVEGIADIRYDPCCIQQANV